jgi:hypothetical protein
MKWLKSIWKDPVGSAVIGAVISAIIISLATYFLGLWPKILGFLMIAFLYLNSSIKLPIWLILILVPVLLFAFPIIKSISPEKENFPRFIEYTSDSLFGINWNWEWAEPDMFEAKYRIRNLRPRCPLCGAALDVNQFNRPQVTCINDSCSWCWNRLAYNSYNQPWDLRNKVLNEIDRKIYVDQF